MPLQGAICAVNRQASAVTRPRPPLPHLAHELEHHLNTCGYELLDAQNAARSATFEVSAGQWHAFDTPGHGALNVLVPLSVQVSVDASGQVTALKAGKPTSRELHAAKASLGDLIANGQLDDPLIRSRATHATYEVVTQADGRRAVRRRGFAGNP